MTAEQIDAASEKLAERLWKHPAYKNAQSIYGYMSYNQEVRTMKILERAQSDGKRVAIPKVKGSDMVFIWLDNLNDTVPGYGGIAEPAADGPEADDETALVLMPGIAFDKDGHRCGYGGGFYDRYLEKHTQHTTLALCYGFQMFEDIKTEEYDVPVNFVLSEDV